MSRTCRELSQTFDLENFSYLKTVVYVLKIFLIWEFQIKDNDFKCESNFINTLLIILIKINLLTRINMTSQIFSDVKIKLTVESY